MINYTKRFKKFINCLVFVLIWLCIIFIIFGFIHLFCSCDVIDRWQAVTDIIIPMVCGLVWACIPIAINNSLSNEKLKISLNRLEWWWKYHCIDKYGNFKSWYESLDFDIEYKFILENRWKSHEKIFRSMTDNYWNTKYSLSNTKLNKEKFLMDWIKDHFIY